MDFYSIWWCNLKFLIRRGDVNWIGLHCSPTSNYSWDFSRQAIWGVLEVSVSGLGAPQSWEWAETEALLKYIYYHSWYVGNHAELILAEMQNTKFWKKLGPRVRVGHQWNGWCFNFQPDCCWILERLFALLWLKVNAQGTYCPENNCAGLFLGRAVAVMMNGG